jgi:hypothetical protein
MSTSEIRLDHLRIVLRVNSMWRNPVKKGEWQMTNQNAASARSTLRNISDAADRASERLDELDISDPLLFDLLNKLANRALEVCEGIQ